MVSMTEERKPGFLASYLGGRKEESNKPTSSPYLALSPYMNFDPNLIQSTDTSQFIIPEGQAEERGRLELMFFNIGAAILTGGAIGGTNGFINGFKNSATLPARLRRTMILNYITRQSTVGASAMGSLGLLFGLTDVALGKARGGVEDELNTVLAGTMTGLLYRAPRGLKAAGKAGLIGALITTGYVAVSLRDKIFG